MMTEPDEGIDRTDRKGWSGTFQVFSNRDDGRFGSFGRYEFPVRGSHRKQVGGRYISLPLPPNYRSEIF